ncbi:MAG: tetratricopeptide repeat protein [Bacteroidota bacterium]
MNKLLLFSFILIITFGYQSFAQQNKIDSLKFALQNAKHDTTRCNILSILSKIASEKEWPNFNKALLSLTENKLKTIDKSKSDYRFYLKHYASALNNVGYLADVKGDFLTALEYYKKSLDIDLQIDDKQGVAACYNNIGYLYRIQGENLKAIEFYEKSLKIKEKLGDKYGVANSLNNLGSIYRTQNNFFKANEYFEKSLKIREHIGDKVGIAFSLNSLGFLFDDQGNKEKARDFFYKSLRISEEINNKNGMVYSLNALSNIYIEQANYSKALEYGLKSMKYSKELDDIEKIRNTSKILYKIYKIKSDYKKAIENYELFIEMRDSISNLKNQKALIQNSFQYEYDKKAAADSVKAVEEKKVTDLQLKQEKTQRFALYGGLALVVVFAIFMYNRFRVTHKQKQIIEIKEKETQQQKHIIEEKHKEITDSINYAERIQRSFLATKELLDENLNDYFVLFQPKDVVSGDFYWATKLSNGNFALATADSTGHGVPGAIMSLLNITSLESAIKDGFTQPAEILNATRKTIIERLKKDGSADGGKDGMDCSLTVYDFKQNKLFVTAANNPVWIVRTVNSELALGSSEKNNLNVTYSQMPNGYLLIEIKPEKMPVGKHDKQDVLFTQHEIDLQSGDVIYTLTDGFPDQFGGESGKKFMSKKLRELLLANANLPMQEQKELLQTTFKNWVGDLEQVDDVCVIGVRV